MVNRFFIGFEHNGQITELDNNEDFQGVRFHSYYPLLGKSAMVLLDKNLSEPQKEFIDKHFGLDNKERLYSFCIGYLITDGKARYLTLYEYACYSEDYMNVQFNDLTYYGGPY